MSVSVFKYSLLSAAVVSALLPSAYTHAQRESLVLEEVIVTARKRQESLQETPVAVTALSNGAT